MSADAIIDLDIFNLSAEKLKKAASSGNLGSGKRSDNEEEEEIVEDGSPLFWQPGKRGYYSPRAGKCTPERLNAFRNVGR